MQAESYLMPQLYEIFRCIHEENVKFGTNLIEFVVRFARFNVIPDTRTSYVIAANLTMNRGISGA